MNFSLHWLDATKLRVDADSLLPEHLHGKTVGEASSMLIPLGNGKAEVGELFHVTETFKNESEPSVEFQGDMPNVRSLGKRMSMGSLLVTGRAGADFGLQMSGGRLKIIGDAGNRAGVEMSGGTLFIEGNAGDSLGGANEGARLGMRNGVIVVTGNAGDDAGRRMRRGLIVVQGKAGDGLGTRLVAGSIFGFGDVGVGTGIGMKRGTIALLSSKSPRLLPSFIEAGRFRFPFLSIYFDSLLRLGISIDPNLFQSSFRRYNGDLNESGRGEILSLA